MPAPHLNESRDGSAIAHDAPPRDDRGGASRVPAPTPAPTADPALRHARSIIAALFGAPAVRAFDVRYWDGSVERAGPGESPYRLVINGAGALRRSARAKGTQEGG